MAEAIDLGVVMGLRKQVADMDRRMASLNLQMIAMIYAQPDHKITMTEQDYDNVPTPFTALQVENDDGSFTIEVRGVSLDG